MDAELRVAADFLEERHPGSVSAYLRREPSFITGSRVYGTPRYNSDVDLVVFISTEELDILARKLSPKITRHCTSFHIGNLNLICATDYNVWQKWREATDNLIARKPVTKAQAIAEFARIFGEPISYDNYPDDSLDDS